MARKPRVLSDMGLYHVTMRGNNQQVIFFDKRDKQHFKKKLKQYVKELHIELYSYCLMSNHIHLEIGNATETMSLLVKKLACSYVPYFNKKYKRSGHLFQGRFTSEPIYDVEYFMNTAGYIINNPELAGVAPHNKYKWNSYQEYFNNEKVDDFVNSEKLINIAGSKEKLKQFFKDGWINNYNKREKIFRNPDDFVIPFINQLFAISNPQELCRLPYIQQKKYIERLKTIGLPISQLSRITGISKGLFYKKN